MATPANDRRRLIRRLYHGLHGYAPHLAEERVVAQAGSSAMYGELLPGAVHRLLGALRLQADDVFYDLGSGVGKLAVQAALTVPIRAVVGIEMMPSRHALACRALARVDRESLLVAEQLELRCEDFMRARMPDATVVYTCSTAFPDGMLERLMNKLARLKKLRILVSLQEAEPHRAFELTEVLRLDASWRRRTKIHVYHRRSKATQPR